MKKPSNFLRPSSMLLPSMLLTATLVAGGASALGDEDSSWHVDLKYGESSLDRTFGSIRTRTFDDDSNVAAVEVGFRFNDYIGVQAGYHDLGTFDGTGSPCFDIEGQPCIQRLATLELCAEGFDCLLVVEPLEAEFTGWSLAAVPSWPFTDRLSAFGKIGLMNWEGELFTTTTFPSFGRVATVSDTDLLTAVGLRYRFGRHASAVVEHQRFDLDLSSSTLGIGWAF